MAIKLFISPSTQDANLGPGGYVEAVHMNAIADILIPELVRHGFAVLRNNRHDDFNGHIAKSKAWGPDYHIAMHSNATGVFSQNTIRGCEVYCRVPGTANDPGTLMAHALYNRFQTLTPTPDRGVKDGLHTLSEVAYTHNGVLSEIDYHNNPAGAVWIAAHHAEIADAYLRGILDRTGVAYIPPPAPPVPVPDPEPEPTPDPVLPTTIYRVQIGAYYNRDNAQALADRATTAGFAPTIRQEDVLP